MTTACDMCIDALSEEFGEVDDEMATMFLAEMGADIPDHLCESVEVPGAACACACKRG